jgi:hypothetical protein
MAKVRKPVGMRLKTVPEPRFDWQELHVRDTYYAGLSNCVFSHQDKSGGVRTVVVITIVKIDV